MHDEIIKRIKRNGKRIDWNTGKVIKIGASNINKDDIKYMKSKFGSKKGFYMWVTIFCILIPTVILPVVFDLDIINLSIMNKIMSITSFFVIGFAYCVYAITTSGDDNER